MAHLILCTDVKPVTVQAFGNWFSFKPGQVKSMDPRLVDFLTMDKKSYGFIALPDICGDDPDSEEAKAAKAEAFVEGRKNIVKELERTIHNLEVSLQKDYDLAGMKVSAVHMEGAAHLPVYRHLAEFKKLEAASNEASINELEQLKGLINGNTIPANTGSTDKGSSNLPKSTGPKE